MTPFWDRPCAAKGLKSYRLRGPLGWIMIGATDAKDALREAARSTDNPDPNKLEQWHESLGRYGRVTS